MISENKKRYNVMLDVRSAEKIIKILKLAGLTLSSYLTVLVDEFAKIVDEKGFSKKLDNMRPSDAVQVMADILKGIEFEKDGRSKK